MKIRKYGSVLAVVLASFVGIAAAQAQTIKISHQWRAETDARDRATRVFVKAVNEKAPELKFRIYPGRSLIQDPVGQFDAMQGGTLEMAVYPLVYAVGKVPEFSITVLPGLVRSLDQAVALKGSDYHRKLQEICEQNGVRLVTWWWTPGGFVSKERPITGPESVNGLKMRAADPYFEKVLQSAGASVHAMPSSEVYTALQTGVLDALLSSSETFVSMRIFEQTKHATAGGDNEIFILLQPLVMSKAAWDKLTPEQQAAFEAAATESEKFFNGVQKEATETMVREFTEAGAKVRSLTDDEYAQWVKLSQDTAWKSFREDVPNGDALISVVQDSIGKLSEGSKPQ